MRRLLADLGTLAAVAIGFLVIYVLLSNMSVQEGGTPTVPAVEQEARIPTGPRSICRPYVEAPDLAGDVYLCPDGRGWQDIGGATSIPPTPRR